MQDPELQSAYAEKIKGFQKQAKTATKKRATSAVLWRNLARLADLLSVGLAGFACASAAISLGDVVTAVTAGLSGAAAAADGSIRPGQVAARARAEQSEWQDVGHLADITLDNLEDLDDAEGKAAMESVRASYQTAEHRQRPKRSEFAPTVW